jgi:hypothetical protein
VGTGPTAARPGHDHGGLRAVRKPPRLRLSNRSFGVGRPLRLERPDDQVADEDDSNEEGEQHPESDGQAAAVDSDSGPCLVAFELGVAVIGDGRIIDDEVVIDGIAGRVGDLARGLTDGQLMDRDAGVVLFTTPRSTSRVYTIAQVKALSRVGSWGDARPRRARFLANL